MGNQKQLTDYVSYFAYDDTIVKEFHKANAAAGDLLKQRSQAEVIALYDLNEFTTSDLHLANIVAKNTFCTEKQILNNLKKYHYTPEGKGVSVLKGHEKDTVKTRLKVLCRCGILTRYIVAIEKPTQTGTKWRDAYTYYSVTPHGYNFLKNVLYYDRNYNPYVSTKSLHDVFKYLSSVSVCQNFMDTLKGFVDYETDKHTYFQKYRSIFDLQGVVKLSKDGIITRILVESIKFNFNQDIVSEEVWQKEIDKQVCAIEEYIKAQISRGEVYAIIPCEDSEGLIKACKLISSKIEHLLPHIFFTIDSALDEVGPEKAFLSVVNNQAVFKKPKFFE